MGTRSFIAQATTNGFLGVYCHWDGYLEHNGKILRDHYTDPQKIQDLLAHGDISILGEKIGSKHDFDNRPDGETNFYGRDRGESDTEATFRKTLRGLLNYANGCGCEFFYLFRNNDWEYAQRGAQYFGMTDGAPFSPLKPLPQL